MAATITVEDHALRVGAGGESFAQGFGDEVAAALRDRIEASGGDQLVHFIELDANGQIVPCGNQKILASNITTLRPSRRLLPVGFRTDYKTRLLPITEGIDAALKLAGPFPKDGETPLPYEVPLSTAFDLIDRLV